MRGSSGAFEWKVKLLRLLCAVRGRVKKDGSCGPSDLKVKMLWKVRGGLVLTKLTKGEAFLGLHFTSFLLLLNVCYGLFARDQANIYPEQQDHVSIDQPQYQQAPHSK